MPIYEGQWVFGCSFLRPVVSVPFLQNATGILFDQYLLLQILFFWPWVCLPSLQNFPVKLPFSKHVCFHRRQYKSCYYYLLLLVVKSTVRIFARDTLELHLLVTYLSTWSVEMQSPHSSNHFPATNHFEWEKLHCLLIVHHLNCNTWNCFTCSCCLWRWFQAIHILRFTHWCTDSECKDLFKASLLLLYA